MKVLLMNGSTRKNGCTYLALSEVAKTLQEEGVEAEIVQLGAGPVRDCIGCNGCQGKGRCVFGDDAVNEWLDKARDADGFIFGSPVYYSHPAGHSCLLWTGCFTLAERVSSTSRERPSSQHGGPVLPPRWMC